LVSGSLSIAIHGGIMVALIVAAAFAPVDHIIPVSIIREKPGAKEEPAPAPKRLVPRRAVARTAAPQVVRQIVAQQVVTVTPQVVAMAKVANSVPTEISRPQAVAQTVTAHSQTVGEVQMNYSQVSPTAVRVVGIQAPQAVYTGPQVVDVRAPVAVAPQFVDYAANAQQSYGEQTELSADQLDTSAMGIEIETAVSDSLLEGQGTGGNGRAIGTVACRDSAPVHRYYGLIKKRTLAHWNLPTGTPSGEEVRLRFELDSSGSATRVEFLHATSVAVGDSAVRALRDSSPFPAMNDAVRDCLADTPQIAIFTVPSV
jgi:hypothetical protein